MTLPTVEGITNLKFIMSNKHFVSIITVTKRKDKTSNDMRTQILALKIGIV